MIQYFNEKSKLVMLESYKEVKYSLDARAFTLIELIIVVTLIGILASIALIKYGPVMENARSAEAYSVLSQIVAAEKAYYLEKNNYTTTWADLDRFDAEPVSEDFNFIITTATSGYVEANRAISTGGRLSYSMCIASGERNFYNADSADNPCP